jgi:hypothetical protein
VSEGVEKGLMGVDFGDGVVDDCAFVASNDSSERFGRAAYEFDASCLASNDEVVGRWAVVGPQDFGF